MWRNRADQGDAKAPQGPPRRPWRYLPAVLAAVLGAALTVVIFDVVTRFDRERLEADFRRGADERTASVRHHVDEVFGTLEQVRGLYYSSSEVERGEFREYTDPLLKGMASLRAMLWVPRVPAKDRPRLEALARAGGLPDFRIAPEPGDRESFPVFYRESASETAHPLGTDLSADAVCRKAMDQAADSGRAVCTGRVTANAAGLHDVLVFLPVYAPHVPTEPASPPARRQRLSGFIVAVVSPRGLLLESVKPLAPAGLRLRLYDLSARPPGQFLHGLARREEHADETQEFPAAHDGPIDRRDLSVGGRTWQLAITPTPTFFVGRRSYTGWVVLACGLFITGLATAYVAVLLGQAHRIRTEVEARTGELRREIANREKVEAALVLQKGQAQQYLDVAGVILLVLDRSGLVVLINRKGCEVLGRCEGEILGVNWFDAFVLEADREPTRAAFGRLIDGRAEPMASYENHVLDSAGRCRTITWQNVLVHDDQGNVVGALSSGADVTDQREAERDHRHMEAQVLHTQKLESLGVLAGGIAHDFNNILTAVLGHADLALRELPLVSPARGNLHEIANAARRAADLCRQLLAYSGKGRFVVEPIDLSALIEEMTHLIEVSVSKKVTLRRQFVRPLPAVDCDATQIRQVVINLITNASEAIGEAGGEILVTTGSMVCDYDYLQSARITDHLAEGPYVTLEVSDNGCGMDSAVRERIFDPFFSTKFAGRGLGLAAVLGIVRGHKGGIKVYSEPGKGSTFKVFLPASAAQPRPIQTPPDGDGGWRGKGTVLLVDDEECVRTLGRDMLVKMGFTVLLADNGQQGLDIFRQQHEQIACVVLDLTMPRMDGEEAFRAFRSVRPDVRVILCSGYNQQEVTQRFVGKGLAGFIQKPFEYATLAAKLREAIQP